MALKSITGTTGEIIAALADIGTDTSVTITDDSYNSVNLLAIIAKTDKTITLQKTAAWTTLSADSADLVKILKQVNKYTGPITVTATVTDPSADELGFIAKKTTGKVTAELVDTTLINKDTVNYLKDLKATDDIAFKPLATSLSGKDELNALLAIKKLIPNADFSAILTIDADAKDVALVENAVKLVAPNVAVNITGDISAADANAIAKATNGVVTATIKAGSVAATLNALKDVNPAHNDVLKFKSTDKTADAKALVDLDTLLDTSDFSSVQTITSKAADVANVTTALALASVGHPAVTITGAISAADANAIADATDGKVTATITPGEAATIAGVLTDAAVTDALNITVNGTNAAASNLITLYGKTSLKITVDAAKVTGSFADLKDIYVTNKSKFTALGNENVEITDLLAVPSSDVNTILKATTGVVTAATVTADTAANLVANLKDANANDALTLTVTGMASAKDLLTLVNKTSKNLVTAGVTTITGTAAEVKKVYDTLKTGVVGDEDITLTGTVKAVDANYILGSTSGVGVGVVTATIAADTAENLNNTLTNASATDKLKLIVNGATASATALNSLATKTFLAIKVDAKEITGSIAEATAVYVTNAADYTNLGNKNVVISPAFAGTATAGVALGDLDGILDATTGIVTATLTSDTATNLLAKTTKATAKDALTLTVTGATATADDLLTLDGRTSVTVKASAVTAISGNAADVKKLVAAKGVEIAKGVNFDLSATTTNASDLATILKATTGKVTATVAADTAAKLNAALKDADSSDALTLTVNGTTATAKDLISLDAKTNVDITLSVGAITGNITEITKVFVDDADNFTNEGSTAATISGEITAAQAEAIADVTSKVVTATIAAGTAEYLNTELATDTIVNAYKLTVSGTDANAADLNDLDGLTTVAVNANAIKNIIGTGLTGAQDVADAYLANAKKDISGLGNETVNLDGAADADVALVNAINAYTTGVITLPELVLTNTGAATFNLNQLGDLKGITGLVDIALGATNGVKDTINISLKDLLAANDSKNNFTFNVTGTELANDKVNITNDVSGWTQAEITADTKYTYTNDKTGQVVTIEANAAVINA